MLPIIEEIQKGYIPFIITFVCFSLALLFTLIQKRTQKSSSVIQESFLTKLFAIFGLSLGGFLRSSEILAINTGKHSADGLPFAGPFVLMAAMFLLAHTYISIYTKGHEDHTKKNDEMLVREIRLRFILILVFVMFGIVESLFLRF